MPHQARSFRQSYLKRIIRAARAAGVKDARLEIDPVTGKISITIGDNSGTEKISDLDKWIAEDARQT